MKTENKSAIIYSDKYIKRLQETFNTMKTNEKNVMINIKSAHFTPNEYYERNVTPVDVFSADSFDSVNAQRIDIDYEGVLSVKNGRLSLKYDESELTGMEGTVTSISFDVNNPSLVVMSRTGTVEGTLCFEDGERIMCTQNIPEMELPLVIDTEHMVNSITEDGGELKISYGMEYRGSLVQRTLMHVVVRPT